MSVEFEEIAKQRESSADEVQSELVMMYCFNVVSVF